VEALLAGKSDLMIGIVNNQINFTPFAEATGKVDNFDPEMLRIANILSL